MIRKFLDGLAFGAGFGVAFISFYVLAMWLIIPSMIGTRSTSIEPIEFSGPDSSENSASTKWSKSDYDSFFDATIEEQIEAASAIALAEYQPAADGRMMAVISEYLKVDPGVELPYGVGDEHPNSSYYPDPDKFRGDGLVIFFTGSPAKMVMSSSFNGDRISGLGDIPVALFREKCGPGDDRAP